MAVDTTQQFLEAFLALYPEAGEVDRWSVDNFLRDELVPHAFCATVVYPFLEAKRKNGEVEQLVPFFDLVESLVETKDPRLVDLLSVGLGEYVRDGIFSGPREALPGLRPLLGPKTRDFMDII